MDHYVNGEMLLDDFEIVTPASCQAAGSRYGSSRPGAVATGKELSQRRVAGSVACAASSRSIGDGRRYS